MRVANRLSVTVAVIVAAMAVEEIQALPLAVAIRPLPVAQTTRREKRKNLSTPGMHIENALPLIRRRDAPLSLHQKAVILGPESFELSVPPAGWSQFTGSSSPNHWTRTSNAGCQGSYVAWVTHDPVNSQDEYLQTSEMDFSTSAGCTLTFCLWQSDSYDDYLYVGVSTDGGGPGGTWDVYGPLHQTGSSWDAWNLGLSAYDGEPSVTIAFDYYTATPNQDSEGIDYVIVTGTDSLPNLVPYTPSGWSGPIVCSTDPDTIAEDTLVAGKPYYISWAVANFGSADVTDTFHVVILDTTFGVFQAWAVPSLPQGSYVSVKGFCDTVFAPGSYQFYCSADFWSAIVESDETDNDSSETYCWATEVKPWTILVFINGDNNLESAGIDDIDEMERGIVPSLYNVIVQFDRIPGGDASNGDWTTTRRYLIDYDAGMDNVIRSTLIEDLGERNMGDPNELIEFANWGMGNFPADNYLLVIWDHGNGWYKKGPQHLFKGISHDVTDDDIIGVANGEYAYAMESISCSLGGNIDVLANDACLMGMHEVAYEVKDFVDFAIFSEYLEPGDGYPYDDILNWLNTHPNATSRQLSEAVVDEYVASYSGGSQGSADVTQSALALNSGFVYLSHCINRFAEELMNIGGRLNPGVESAYWLTSFFHYYWPPDMPDKVYPMHIDMYDFAHNIRVSATLPASVKDWADSVMYAIDSVVVREGHYDLSAGFPDLIDCHGLAIYYPADSIWEYGAGSDTLIIDSTYQDLDFMQQLPNWWNFINGKIIHAEDSPESCPEFALFPPTPNPSRSYLMIQYALPKKAEMSLSLFDVSGRQVKQLFSGEQKSGRHSMELKLSTLIRGTYFIRLESGSLVRSQKITILE
jgi:hypothetical protein